jgi:general stress protein 26
MSREKRQATKRRDAGLYGMENQTQHLTGDQALKKVWELLKSTMMVTQNGGHVNSRPMGLQSDADYFAGELWFITDRMSQKVDEIGGDSPVPLVLQDDGDSAYMQLNGRAKAVEDRGKLRQLYSPVLKTWFPEGLDDPRMTLLRFEAEEGKFWDSPDGMLQVVAAFTKAVVTCKPARGGEMGEVTFYQNQNCLRLWGAVLSHEHGAMGIGHYALRHAADEELLHTAFVAGADDDKVRAPFLGIFGDPAFGIALQCNAIGSKSFVFQPGHGAGHNVGGDTVHGGLDVRGVPSTFEQLQERRVYVFGDREDADQRAFRPGDGGRRGHRIGCPIVTGTDSDEYSHRCLQSSRSARLRFGSGGRRSGGSDDEGDAVEAQMTVRGPAGASAKFAHDGEAVRVGEGERLVGELLHEASGRGQLGFVKTTDRQPGQSVHEGEELNGSLVIVAAKKPPVAFGYHECRRYKGRRRGEQAAEQRVIAIGAVEEGDERRRINVGVSLFGHI